jgi:uncharacterized protein with PIN domain
MKTALFYLLGDLRDFVPSQSEGPVIQVNFHGDQSLKHLIESLNIPHTEIGEIRSPGRVIDLGYIVQDGDQITISPANNPVKEARFLLDNHLGKLTTYLRVLGFDAYYQSNLQDDDLIELLMVEPRILLTRDRRLLMRKIVMQGYCLRSLDPETQVFEVLHRYHLKESITPFHRCLRCNALLQSVEKEQLIPRLQPLTRRYFDEFRVCPDCDQIYWKGSHYDHMQGLITRITERLNNR